MLEIRNLTKSYPTRNGRKYVFRNLNLVVPEGKGVGVMGSNGAGKSTLLRLLGGIDSPDSGGVFTDKSISWPVGLGGGFQGSLSARDNLRFICRVFGATGDAMREKIAWVEDFAQIGTYFDLPMKQYSPGMRARIAFGSSMAFDFDYYLIDEAMAVGDSTFREKASRIFKEKLSRATALLVSHSMKDIREMCSVAVVVHGGHAQVYEDLEEGIYYYESMMKQLQLKTRATIERSQENLKRIAR